MRVLLVSHRFPPDDLGGVERYTQFLAIELSSGGDNVSVFARSVHQGRSRITLLRERLPDGALVYRVGGGNLRFDNFEAFLDHHEHLERLFTTVMLETKPEVVHVNHLLCLPPRIIEIAHRLGAAVVVSLHDFYTACPRVHLQKSNGELCDGPDDGRECARTCFGDGSPDRSLRWGLRTIYFRKLITNAEAVVAYSDYVARFFANFLKNNKTIHVLGNGVSFSPWRSDYELPHVRFPDTPLTLAYCGTLATHKGPHVILEALKIAALPEVNLLLIGHSPRPAYASQLRAAAAEIPRLKMRMYGAYEPKDLCFLLRDVDCVVVPSLVPEAGPVVPREALAEGVPIIAARRGALPELVTEGQNGFTFDSRRPGELAAILRRLATDPEVLPRLQAGARSTINVTVAQHASRIRRIYAEAIDRFDGNHQAWMADASEVNFAHESLLNLGADKTIKPKGALR